MSRPVATLAVTAADVEAAAARIAGSVERTPTAHSVTLSAITGADVYVKFENFQFTASFKDRGARNKLLSLSPEEHARGVVAMSAGNHAQAVAHHATLLGIPATIVMPVWTPQVKVHRTAMLGARVVLEGDDLKEAAAVARGLERDQGMVFVSPYDDAAIIAGAGTVAIELLDDAPQVDTLVVPVGGGGLISGMAVLAHARRPDIRIVGVEAERFPSMANAVRGEHAPVGGTTVAEGIVVPVAGSLTSPIVEALVSDVVTVSEESLEAAIDLFLDIEKVVAEGAGGAGSPRSSNIRIGSVGTQSASCSPAATSIRVCSPRSCSAASYAAGGSRGCVSRSATCRARWARCRRSSATPAATSWRSRINGSSATSRSSRRCSSSRSRREIESTPMRSSAALDRGGFPTELLGATVRDDPTGHLEA